MITSFGDRGTEDIYNGLDTKTARRTLPKSTWSRARRLLDQLKRVRDLAELREPPSNRLETLKGDRKGQHSLRVDKQWRLVFHWHEGNASEVSIVDYHS